MAVGWWGVRQRTSDRACLVSECLMPGIARGVLQKGCSGIDRTEAAFPSQKARGVSGAACGGEILQDWGCGCQGCGRGRVGLSMGGAARLCLRLYKGSCICVGRVNNPRRCLAGLGCLVGFYPRLQEVGCDRGQGLWARWVRSQVAQFRFRRSDSSPCPPPRSQALRAVKTFVVQFKVVTKRFP